MVESIVSTIEREFPGTIVEVHGSEGIDLICSVPVGDGSSLEKCSITVHKDLSYDENADNALFMVRTVQRAGNA